MKVTFGSYTIPAKTVEFAQVKMPNGRIYVVPKDKVHAGNFPETATYLNSVQILHSHLLDIIENKTFINNKFDWSRENTWGGRKSNPYLKPWNTIILDYLEMKTGLIKLAKEIHANGGWSKYNYPEQAKQWFRRLALSPFIFVGKDSFRYINRDKAEKWIESI